MVSCDVEPTFRGNLGTVLRNEADEIRTGAHRDLDDLGGITHLEIESGTDLLTQFLDIPIDDVATILSQVGSDRVRASGLSLEGRGDRARFGVRGIEHRHETGVPQRGDMIDIDT